MTKTQESTTSNLMATGNIPKLLAQLAIPAVIAQIINLLYNIVDRIYICHIPNIGAAALTGVGLFTPILMLLNAFAMLVGSGGAPRAAIAMGKNDNNLAEKIVVNCFTLLFGISILLPNFFSNKVFAVFLAEPVSDILTAAVTTITFFTLFNKILKKEVR